MNASGAAEGRFTFECHGAVVAVESADGAALEVIRPLLPSSASATAQSVADATYRWRHVFDRSGRHMHEVTVRSARGGRRARIARLPDRPEAAELLAHDLEYRVALHARGRVFVHAAAVAWQGRAILVPGRSFTGKTTLASALVRHGAAYLSDEYAVLDEAGLVHPFPRRLRLRDASGAPAGRSSAEELGGTTARRPLPVGLVVWTSFRDRAHWQPRLLSPGQTALALLDNTVVARLHPAYAMRVIARALDGAVGLRGRRGDADETASRILEYACSVGATPL